MVDRITPATTNEHRQLVHDKFGIVDDWPVMTEPFRQWVIEDRFVQSRPAWEKGWCTNHWRCAAV
jgi:mannitol 2-dehydrogenase